MLSVNTRCAFLNFHPKQSNQSHLLRPHKQELTHSNKILKMVADNYKQSVIDSDDSVKQIGSASYFRKIPNLIQTTGFSAPTNAITKFYFDCMRGIVKMSVNYFYAAFNKSTTLTKNFSGMLYPFDFKYLLGGLSELKILVSVVRFRPEPPFSNRSGTVSILFGRRRQNILRLSQSPLTVLDFSQ